MKAVPHTQRSVKFAPHLLVLLSTLCLPGQSPQPGLDLADQVMHAQDVLPGLVELAKRVGPARLIAGQSSGLLDQPAPLLWAQRQRCVDQALPDDGIRALGEPTLAEQIVEIAEAHSAAIEQVHVLAGTIRATGDRHFRKLDRQPVRAIVQRDSRLCHTHARAAFAAGKDHILALFGTQQRKGLLAQHPTHGIGNVGLATAVRTDNRRDPSVKEKLGAVGECLVAQEVEMLKSHRLLCE